MSPKMITARSVLFLTFVASGALIFQNCSGLYSTSDSASVSSNTATSANIRSFDQTTFENKPVVLCAADLVNSPTEQDASRAIEQCAEGGNKIVEFLPGRYFIRKGIVLTAQSKARNVVFRTRGVTGGPACLDANSKDCAVWTASDAQGGGSVSAYGPPRIINVLDSDKLTFYYIALDGARSKRTQTFQQFFKSQPSGTDKNKLAESQIAWNARFEQCNGCQFVGFASVNTTQGSALNTEHSDDVLLDTVLIRDAGWGLENLEGALDMEVSQFSDGFTHNSGDRLTVKNSKFIECSDVNLIVGGGTKNASITNNLISNRRNFSFAAFMFDSFNDNARTRLDGSVFELNRIDCGQSMCGIGIMIGPRLWYWNGKLVGATVRNNTVSGARQGLLSWYAEDLAIYGNTITSFGEQTVVTRDFRLDDRLKTNAYAIDRTDTNSNIDDSKQNTIIGGKATENGLKLLSASAGAGGQPARLIEFFPTNNGATHPFVGKLYHDIFGRAPDLSGGPAFSAELNAGRLSKEDIRMQLASSDEAKKQIVDLYAEVLKRNPSDSEALMWQTALGNGSSTVSKFYRAVMTSDEAIQAAKRSK